LIGLISFKIGFGLGLAEFEMICGFAFVETRMGPGMGSIFSNIDKGQTVFTENKMRTFYVILHAFLQ